MQLNHEDVQRLIIIVAGGYVTVSLAIIGALAKIVFNFVMRDIQKNAKDLNELWANQRRSKARGGAQGPKDEVEMS